MDRTVMMDSTLSRLVDLDPKVYKVKDLAVLFLSSMNDWPTFNQDEIADFVTELKNYFGSPVTIKAIDNKKFDGKNAWQLESGSSIVEMIKKLTQFSNENNFDKILQIILNYYEEEFSKVDFTAELKYRTTAEGGRKTAAHSGYRPQIQFAFSEKQTAGEQTFIDKEIVLPGETVKAKIKILSPDLFVNSLTEGMAFEFREGGIFMGTGQILEIINDRLEK